MRTLAEPSLLAGKLHALLARAFLNRVKGRDCFDFLFLAARDTPVNMTYLEAKLRDSEHYDDRAPLSVNRLVAMLRAKFQQVDFAKARDDVRPFLDADAARALDDWSSELFVAVAETLRAAG